MCLFHRSIKHEVERKLIAQLAAAQDRGLIHDNCKVHVTINCDQEKCTEQGCEHDSLQFVVTDKQGGKKSILNNLTNLFTNVVK